jgi:3-oxoadipate enol-lactonase
MAIDLPGHGASEVPADMDCSPDGVARWFSALLDSEGLVKVDLLGHSFGGVVAMNLALEASGRVRRLVGVNVANLDWATEPFREGAYELMGVLARGELDVTSARDILGRIYSKDPASDEIVAGADFWTLPGVSAFFRQGGWRFSRSLPVWRLRELALPVLLVWGEGDRFLPVEGARTGTMYLPDSRLLVIASAGHSPFVDAPEMFRVVVDAFLEATG